LLLTILAFIVVLGITITVHEFGHFAMAKLLKIRVLVFSLGFGPRLVGFTRGGTEYRLSPFPIGGYVKMAGEAYGEQKGAPDEFLSHPKWHRFLVAVAGPMMNILLAVLILMISYMQGVSTPRYPKEPAIVGPVAAGSLAADAGLRTGDRVVSVSGNRTETWEDLEVALGTAAKDSLDLEVGRDGRTLRLHLEPPPGEGPVDAAALGFKFPLERTIVYMVDKASPAYRAGLRDGDEILSASRNGRTEEEYSEILNLISESEGVPLRFRVLRPPTAADRDTVWESPPSTRGETLDLTITPVRENGRVIVGFVADYPSDLQKFGLIGALTQSMRRNVELSALTFRIIGRIFKGSASVKTLSGPIEIARISGSAARTGSARVFFGLLGLISLQLGIFNLLPIPILDGGVIALLLVEGILRRDLSINLKEKIVQVGFLFLILLMGFVVFNDLAKVLNLSRILP
jgi:regulator of sigma E protease